MREDYFIVAGRLLFEDLYTPIVPPKSKVQRLRYGATLQVAKDAASLPGLFELIEKVGTEAWGKEADKKLADIQASIDQGWPASKGLVAIQDGDHPNNKPERNAGFYLISATRYDDKNGAPGIFGVDGEPLTASDPGAPRPGDGVLMLFNVWAQPMYERVNFTLESVRKAVEGVPLGGGPSAGDRVAAREAFSQAQLPTSIAGVQPAAAIAQRAGGAAGTPTGWGGRAGGTGTNVPVEEAPKTGPGIGRRVVKSL